VNGNGFMGKPQIAINGRMVSPVGEVPSTGVEARGREDVVSRRKR